MRHQFHEFILFESSIHEIKLKLIKVTIFFEYFLRNDKDLTFRKIILGNLQKKKYSVKLIHFILTGKFFGLTGF